MSLPTIADCFRVAFNASVDRYHSTNVMHFLAPSKDESDVFDTIAANMSSDLWALQPAGWTISEVVVTKLDGTPDGIAFFPPNTTAWQGGTGTDYNPQVCALLKFLTGASGRRGRGRCFLPFVVDSVITRGIIDPTNQADLQADWITFANAMETDGVALAVASYVGAMANQVLAIQAEAPTATQRRRQIR